MAAMLLASAAAHGQPASSSSASSSASWNADSDAPAAAESKPGYHALVIGINDYPNFPDGSGWEPLRNARTDAVAVGRVLREEYGFSVRTLTDGEATRSRLMQAFDQLGRMTPDDAVLVYFSGHGFYDPDLDEGFWIPQDARRVRDGRPAKEEWLWNSTLTKIFAASPARHVLVVADSCYSGSLFRGAEEILERRRFSWYQRAQTRPSRYLLTSGDLEPVLDSGARHSIFAQQVLHYLAHPDQDIFSASDLGRAVRTRVSALTGQMVRMGPLPVASHAGGEFVFLRRDASFPELAGQHDAAASQSAARPEDEPLQPETAEEPDARRRAVQDALVLSRRGAPSSAQAALDRVAAHGGDGDADSLRQAAARYLQTQSEGVARDELAMLIEQLESAEGAPAVPDEADALPARPRILVCLGPEARGADEDGAASALLYRVCLYHELRAYPGMRLVDREALEDVIRELRLGTSVLSERNARLVVGRLLPASLLLFGSVVPGAEGESLYLRLVDTETTEVVDTLWMTMAEGRTVADVCREAAARIAARSREARPLTARIEQPGEDALHAEIGSFHGAATGMTFRILARVPRGDGPSPSYDERPLGSAMIADLGEWSSTFRPDWTAPIPADERDRLWLREAAP
jgi:hypothetical protein